MVECRLKLHHEKAGDPERITFRVAPTDLARAKVFMTQKNEREKSTGEPVWIDATLRFWYPERTPAQNRFYWRFVAALAQKASMNRSEMHETLKDAFLPREEVTQKKLVKRDKTWELIEFQNPEAVSTTSLTTVEFAAYCEQVILLCADQGLDIYQDFVEWHEWLAENQWPLSETYRNVDEYRQRHSVCEFCGKDIKWEDGRYLRNPGEIMHILSRGSGGPDAAWNLIHGCIDCHRLRSDSQHVGGWAGLIEAYPHMKYRIEYAEKKNMAPTVAQKGSTV